MVTFELTARDAKPPVRATGRSAGRDVFVQLVDWFRVGVNRDGSFLWVPEGREIKFRDEQNRPYELRARRDALAGQDESDASSFWVTLQPGHRALVPMGFKARVPNNKYAAVVPRSGEPWKYRVEVGNAPGTIDADFPNEWMVMLDNKSEVPYEIQHHMRACQVILKQYEDDEWHAGTVVPTTERGGGHGSTGR